MVEGQGRRNLDKAKLFTCSGPLTYLCTIKCERNRIPFYFSDCILGYLCYCSFAGTPTYIRHSALFHRCHSRIPWTHSLSSSRTVIIWEGSSDSENRVGDTLLTMPAFQWNMNKICQGWIRGTVHTGEVGITPIARVNCPSLVMQCVTPSQISSTGIFWGFVKN